MPAGQALVLVDVQGGFITADTEHALDRIGELMNGSWDLVAATRFRNCAGSLYRSELDWHDMGSGSPGSRLTRDVAQRADTIVDKTGYSAAETLLPELTRRRITEVVLAGMDTDACVLATAFGMWDAGFRVRIDAAGCASGGGPALHIAGLNVARQVFGPKSVIPAGSPVG